MRKRVLVFVLFAAVRDAIKERKAEEAVRLARAGDFQPLRRVWILTEAARLLARPSRARRLADDTAELAYALTAVAARLFEVDRARGWEAAAEAVKAVNKVGWFTGTETKSA